MTTRQVLGSSVRTSRQKKIRFDTDLVLLRILDHLNKNGTAGERCTMLMECLYEYKLSDQKKIPTRLKELNDPYGSVQQLLNIYIVALDEHQFSSKMLGLMWNWKELLLWLVVVSSIDREYNASETGQGPLWLHYIYRKWALVRVNILYIIKGVVSVWNCETSNNDCSGSDETWQRWEPRKREWNFHMYSKTTNSYFRYGNMYECMYVCYMLSSCFFFLFCLFFLISSSCYFHVHFQSS